MGFASGVQAEEKPGSEDLKFFEERIRPVLAERCYACHNSRDTKEGNLAVDHRAAIRQGGKTGPAVVPGQPGKSLLLQVVQHEIEGKEMPQGEPMLKAGVLADLTEWIKRGAPTRATARLPRRISRS